MSSILYLIFVVLFISLTKADIDFIVTPRSQAIIFREDLYLHCLFSQSVDSNYNTSVEWTLNGGLRPESSSIFSNNTLLVPKMVDSYLGNYTCVVMETTDNSTLAISSPALIIHAYIKPFQTNPLPLNVMEGDNSVLECITGESSPPPEIYWERNDKKFPDGQQINSTFKSFIPYGLVGQFYMKLVLTASPVNAGMFSCVARNTKLGINVKSWKVFLNVTAIDRAPYVDDTLQNSSVISAQNLPMTINCPVRGHPRPIISWYKNNNQLQEDHRLDILTNGSLYISDLQLTDDGHYTCKGSNSLGSASSSQIHVKTAYMDIDFVREPYNAFVIAGQPNTLPCSPPISFPLSSVVWYKDDRPLVYRSGEQSVFIVDPNNGIWDLFFSNIQKMDEGNYFCVAVNNYSVPSTRTSKVAEISVGGAPIFIQKPSDTSVVKGNGVKVTCLVDGDPFPTVTWLLDRLSIVVDSTVMLRLQNQELHISNINKSREGMYTCRARNIYGIIEAEAYVQVLVPPVVTRKLTNTTVKVGMGTILTCDVYGDPKPDIVWYKDGVKIQSSDGITVAYDRFYINNVTLSSAGWYGCQATNIAGSVSTYGQLIVKVKPYYISGPTDKQVVMGDSLTFTCEVEGYPEPSMDWLYNGTQLFPPGVLVSLDFKTLSISSVNWAHVGSYTCVAANMEGTSTKTGIVSLHVPPWIVDIVGNPIVYQNKDMELVCQLTGIPTPVIQWYRYGNIISPTQDGRIYFPTSNRLAVKVIQVSDAGSYTCSARNSLGTSEKSIPVFVIEPPVPPVLGNPTVISASSISLTWEPVTQKPHTDVTQYMVYYKEKTSIQYQRYTDIIDGSQTIKEIAGLRPGTEYMFAVSASNPAGEGDRSNIKLAKTFDSGPSEPRSFKVLDITSNSVALQWLIPQVTNGQIRKYQILYKEKTSISALITEDFDVISVEVLMTYTVNNLQPYTVYEFLVRAATIQGDSVHWGNLSDSIEVKTSAAAPIGSPVNVQLTVLSPYSVYIQWREVSVDKQNGPITKYHIKYWQQKLPNNVKTVIVQHPDMSADVDGLLPWRLYSFVIEAENGGGLGPTSDVVVIRTHAAAPSRAPINVTAVPLSATDVGVSVKLPDSEFWNSDLSGFYVEYVPVDLVLGPTVTVNSSINRLSVNISGLSPWTSYRVRAALFTNLSYPGIGPYSDWTYAQTLSSDPGPVSGVNYQVTPTSISLYWNSPTSPNGVVLYYLVKVHDPGVGYGSTMETTNVSGIGQSGSDTGKRKKRDTENLVYRNSVEKDFTVSNDVSAKDRSILINICDVVIQTNSEDLLQKLVQNRTQSGTNSAQGNGAVDGTSSGVSTELSTFVHSLSLSTINWLDGNNMTYILFCEKFLNFTNDLMLFDNSTLSIFRTVRTSIILSDLFPNYLYNVSVMAVNSVGPGQEVSITVITASLPPPPANPTTTRERVTVSTTTSLLLRSEYSVEYPQRLMYIIGGCVAGAVLVVMVIVLFTCLCIRRDGPKYVNSDRNRLGEEWSQEPQLTSNSDTTTESSNESRGSTSKIHFTANSVRYDTHDSTREPSYKQYGYMKEDTSVPGILSVPVHDFRPEHSIGIVNPAYREGASSRQGDRESVSVSMTLSAEDFYSQAESSTLKRKSHMKNESAEAIAVLRNSLAPGLRTNEKVSLINNDASVVYSERTAL